MTNLRIETKLNRACKKLDLLCEWIQTRFDKYHVSQELTDIISINYEILEDNDKEEHEHEQPQEEQEDVFEDTEIESTNVDGGIVLQQLHVHEGLNQNDNDLDNLIQQDRDPLADDTVGTDTGKSMQNETHPILLNLLNTPTQESWESQSISVSEEGTPLITSENKDVNEPTTLIEISEPFTIKVEPIIQHSVDVDYIGTINRGNPTTTATGEHLVNNSTQEKAATRSCKIKLTRLSEDLLQILSTMKRIPLNQVEGYPGVSIHATPREAPAEIPVTTFLSTQFPCSRCRKVFNSEQNLTKHMKIYHKIRPPTHTIICEHCNKKFQSQKSLKNHMRRKHKDIKRKCPICEKTCSTNQDLKNHLRIHTGEKPFGCLTCGKHFRLKQSLRIHIRSHTGETPYHCSLCSRQFSTSSSLKYHENSHQKAQANGEQLEQRENVIHKCPTCDKELKTKLLLIQHIRIHTGEKPYKCPHCDKAFRLKQQIQMHARVHTGEKPYSCKLCGKTFGSYEGSKYHERVVHTGEKPFSCKICQRNFACNSQRRRHERDHTQGKLYNCKYCEHSFRSSSARSLHEKKHTGQNSKSCKYCDKKFSSSSTLIIHERMHTGEKPYACSFCGQMFPSEYQCKNHSTIHTGEKPFACTFCPERFRYRLSMKRHIEKDHHDNINGVEVKASVNE